MNATLAGSSEFTVTNKPISSMWVRQIVDDI